eukprot:6737974-Heterocapsa_arctica.AAC.1
MAGRGGRASEVPNAKRRREKEEGGRSGEASPGQMGRRLVVGRALRRGGSSGVRWVDGPVAVASGRRDVAMPGPGRADLR